MAVTYCHMLSLSLVADVINLVGDTPYFADGDLSKFGYGSKVNTTTSSTLINAGLLY